MFYKPVSSFPRAGISLIAVLILNLPVASSMNARPLSGSSFALTESAEPRPDFQVIAAKLVPEAPGASLNTSGVLEYSGRCPVTITFKGYIKVNGPGTVTYNFSRSDGGRGPDYTLVFDRSGRKEVSTTWTLGNAVSLPSFEGFEEIRIESPNRMGSNRAKINIKCSSR
ncbi:MAG TPA: hypothetical protein VGV87_07480 [Blastocatellia bacterium]|jgi:hypothetical protein|nr:hypothetical protein [Blastocatellia bacterium]